MSVARGTTEKADWEEHETCVVAPDPGSLQAQVAAHPFLIGMSEHHVKLLADCAMKVRFQAGQTVFREGESANRFYLIEQGEVGIGVRPQIEVNCRLPDPELADMACPLRGLCLAKGLDVRFSIAQAPVDEALHTLVSHRQPSSQLRPHVSV